MGSKQGRTPAFLRSFEEVEMIKSSFFSLAKPRLAYPALKSEREDVVEIPLPAKAQLFVKGSSAGSNGKGIRVGDRVKTGQRLMVSGDNDEYLIAPVTGSISGISPLTGYLGQTLTVVAFDVEKTDVWDDEFGASKEMSPPQRVRRFLSSLPGQAEFSSLLEFLPLQALVIYGIDKDFLVSTSRCVVQTRLEEIKQGIEVLKKLFGECRMILLVPSGLGLQAERTGMEVRALSPVYPDLLPKAIMNRVFGKAVPAGSRCEEMGVGFLSAEAVAGLGSAFQSGRVPVHKTLTVIKKDGSSVNVRARIGTPVQEILDALHIETKTGDGLIFGGPMTGRSVYSGQTPVLADTDAVMIQDAREEPLFSDTHCVNCGECVRVCPASMPVNMLIRVLENKMYEEAVQAYDLLSCIECGLCSFVCIAQIPIFHYIMLGKFEYERMIKAEGPNA
jgi:Na+-translocating ferredoxin:NAD+ oxidoreductase subunit C